MYGFSSLPFSLSQTAHRYFSFRSIHLTHAGSIDDKYDVAVSTAAPALNHMVVDTVETAQRCVELLRAKNLGKATFICLDKLAYLQAAASAPIGVAPPEPVCVCVDDGGFA